MQIYVETNFVLELALLQEEHESCDGILSLCESGRSALILPAYSLVEPYATLMGYFKRRTRLSNDLAAEVKQLARSKPYREQVSISENVMALLIRSQEEEQTRLGETLSRLLKMAELIPLTPEILSAAIRHRADHGVSPQDSIVYASVLDHLQRSPPGQKCFLNRNSKDFGDSDMVKTLAAHECKMLFNFDDGHAYITHHS
jgi:hypothetical protein